MATAQLNTNYVAKLKTKPEFAGNRGWLSCGVDPTTVMLQLDRRSLFSGHDLLYQPGRLYVEVEMASAKRHASVFSYRCCRYDAALSKQTSTSPVRTSEMLWYELKQSDVTLRLWFQGFFNLDGIWKMLPRPCLVCFHFSWGGERRSHFVPNCWITSANEESHPPSLDQTQQTGPVMKH